MTRDADVDRVFGEALELIDATLVTQYGIAKDDAFELEHSLYDWFHLFSRRPGSSGPAGTLRPHLLLMACQAAHTYSAAKLDEAAPKDERIKRALTLGPQEIAIEMEKKLEERHKRKNGNESQENPCTGE